MGSGHSDAPDEAPTKPEAGGLNGRALRERLRQLEVMVSEHAAELYGRPGEQGGVKAIVLAIGERTVAIERWQAVGIALGIVNLLVVGYLAFGLRHVEDMLQLLLRK